MNIFRNIKKITSNYGTIRFYSASKQLTDVDINKIRNLGILAHIDAGNYYYNFTLLRIKYHIIRQDNHN